MKRGSKGFVDNSTRNVASAAETQNGSRIDNRHVLSALTDDWLLANARGAHPPTGAGGRPAARAGPGEWGRRGEGGRAGEGGGNLARCKS